MPIDPKRSAKPITLTSEQEAEAAAAFVAAVKRELTIEGVKSPFVDKLVASIPNKLVVMPTQSGLEISPLYHTFKYWPDGDPGFQKTPEGVARRLIAVGADRERKAAFGPDPVTILKERLVALGVEADEADALAARCVSRQDDGQVTACDPGGNPIISRPALTKEEDYTPDALTQLRDHNEAVTAATRAILKFRDNPRPPAPRQRDMSDRVSDVL